MTDVTVVALVDGPLGIRVSEWLDERDDVSVLETVAEPDELDVVEETEPDLVLSAGFRHIVSDEILEVPELGAINLHTSYLPYARGANPNVWSIVDDHPAGVSIHYMTAHLDGGEILAQETVPTYPDDDGRDLYVRLIDAQLELLDEHWGSIVSGSPNTIENRVEEGSYHRVSDFEALCELDVDETVRVGDFIDRLRALTFDPFNNAFFEVDGERYYVDVEITPASEVDELTTIKRT